MLVQGVVSLLKYNLDLTDETKWTILTPTQYAKQLMMYITEAGYFCANKKYFTERTDKPEFFLMYVISGEGSLRRENQEIRLTRNKAILVNCDEYQYWKTESDETWKFRWVHFSGPMGKYYYDMLNENDVIHPIEIENSEKLLGYLQNIMESPGVSDTRKSILATMQLNQALSLLVYEKYSERSHTPYNVHRDEINAAISYIRNHYREQIRLEDFDKIVHMSRNYFVRIFKECTSLSPYEYMLHFRIDKAKEMLRTSDYAVEQIAYKVGFQSQSNFISYFKKVTGKTPLNFRNTETNF